ncbi:MAG: copper resistance protein CopC [Methylococcus sp.]|jgi:methionine-rich copper-binding protein CopC|nr:MAG: copper resistance protein CopC [Methylococcus sp.]
MNHLAHPTNARFFFAILFAAALILVSGYAPSAQAHAVVTESSLASEPVKSNHPTTVVLTFNSNVELSLSRVFLVSKGDVFHPADISRGNKPGQLLIKLPGLETGDYAIKYKVFAADGHLTENNIRFHVAP